MSIPKQVAGVIEALVNVQNLLWSFRGEREKVCPIRDALGEAERRWRRLCHELLQTGTLPDANRFDGEMKRVVEEIDQSVLFAEPESRVLIPAGVDQQAAGKFKKAQIENLAEGLRIAYEGGTPLGRGLSKAQHELMDLCDYLELLAKRCIQSDPPTDDERGENVRNKKPTWTKERAKVAACEYIEGHGFPGLNKLARELGCPKATVAKAIKDSTFLKARQAEYKANRNAKSRPREVSLTDTVLEGTEQDTEPDPKSAALKKLIAEQDQDRQRDEWKQARYQRSRKRSQGES